MIRSKRDYIGCAERGLTMAETARELGVVHGSVQSFAKTHGLMFVRGKPGRESKDYAGCAARGMSRTEAAEALGVGYNAVCEAEYRLGIVFTKKQRRPRKTALVLHLTPPDYEAYSELTKRFRYTRAEALTALKREDLIKEPAHAL
jgi:hypothetical protein